MVGILLLLFQFNIVVADDWLQGRGSKDNGISWSHPAFANRHVFIRNDKELVCASLAANQ